jgi:hypothetical protein
MKARTESIRCSRGEIVPQSWVALRNVEALVAGEGEITVGRVGPIRCAAIAADNHQMLAAPVRRRGETLFQLLERLDIALHHAWEDQTFVDEINGVPPAAKRLARRQGARADANAAARRSRTRR